MLDPATTVSPCTNRTEGLENVSWGSEEFTHVSRDRAGIYLCRGGQGRGAAWVWIGVEDTEKLHEELKARGVAIRMAPTNYPWALEMHLEDPDGNVLRLGSDLSGQAPNCSTRVRC